jgi:uncharacterized iron-regulated protein
MHCCQLARPHKAAGRAFSEQSREVDAEARCSDAAPMTITTSIGRGLLLAVTLMTVAGCATQRSKPLDDAADPMATPPPATAAAVAPANWPTGARAQPAFDGSAGVPITWSSLVASATGSTVVLLGEIHGHPMGLQTAAALWEDIAARRPSTSALAMEFIERDEQIHLDDLLSGITDMEAFRAATGRTDGNFPAGHQAMVETALQAGRPVIAANAPRRYVRLSRTEGFPRLEALSEEQRRTFVIPDELTTGTYARRFTDVMTGMAQHGDDTSAGWSGQQVPPNLVPIYRAQNVWDATMAASVADALEQGLAPVMLVTGQFHTDFNGGLTERVRTKARQGMQQPRIMTISIQPVWSNELREDDRGRADVVIYVGE